MESAIRTVVIRPPSARDETVAVVWLGAVIVLLTWAYLALTGASNAGGAPRAGDLLPYQTLFATIGSHDQRVFRQVQEGLLEAENVRSATGAWPDVAALAAQGIPPFASDPISARDGYTWTFRQEGIVVNYLGVPKAPGLSAFLLMIQEPDPLAPPLPSQRLDEQHHRLRDGSILHVYTWTHPDGEQQPDTFLSLPHALGWTQVLVGSDLSTAPAR